MDSKLVACQVDVNGMKTDCIRQTRFATIIRNCTLILEALFYYEVNPNITSLIKSDEHEQNMTLITSLVDQPLVVNFEQTIVLVCCYCKIMQTGSIYQVSC